MADIHPSAVVSSEAKLADDVKVGPFCHIDGAVTLNAGVELISHVYLAGNTTVGERTRIFPFASVGSDPQDLKFKGEDVYLVIGSDCMIREGVTINPGTGGDRASTEIGNNCAFLANSHVAHDCVVGNGVILSNGALIAGHCQIGNHVIMGGGSAVHQFTRIGDNAFIGGLAGVEGDVIPYALAIGNRAALGGLNLIGMKRAGLPRESIHLARRAYKDIFQGDGTLAERVSALPDEMVADDVVGRIIRFMTEQTDRSYCLPRASKND